MAAENRSNEVTVTFRIPADLKEAIQEKIQGRYCTLSEYIRCKIRTDVESIHPPAAPAPDTEAAD
jgi:Arc/MetJ-type ribon-helix-helix transcriptional regulator